jgi:hypothetical protein
MAPAASGRKNTITPSSARPRVRARVFGGRLIRPQNSSTDRNVDGVNRRSRPEAAGAIRRWLYIFALSRSPSLLTVAHLTTPPIKLRTRRIVKREMHSNRSIPRSPPTQNRNHNTLAQPCEAQGGHRAR